MREFHAAMNIHFILRIAFLLAAISAPAQELADLKSGSELSDFKVSHLYSDAGGKIVGAKFIHTLTGAPVFLLRIETVPQAFLWIDTPDNSNKGLPHSLEHLLAGKGMKGRYLNLLLDMRLSQSSAATSRDFNFYGLFSGSGPDAFFEQFQALLDTLFHPDFTDMEAEREFHHFKITAETAGHPKSLLEGGSVYNEMQTGQGADDFYFALKKRVLGEDSPFGFDSGGEPEEMREVTPEEIRRFHARHYRLGPTTGFIFVPDPRERVPDFLRKISGALKPFSQPQAVSHGTAVPAGEPKYSIAPSRNIDTVIYPFPGSDAAAPGNVYFSWNVVRAESQTEVKLMELFFQTLAGDERSLLYKSLVNSGTRAINSGVTAVSPEFFLENSPYYPVWTVGAFGIPGTQITVDQINHIRDVMLATIRGVSEYPDESEKLAEFNELVRSYAVPGRRAQSVWIKSPPGFGSDNRTNWKEYLGYLEMDPAFVRSLSEENVWHAAEEGLKSKKNIWRDLIAKFHLLEPPFAAGSAASPQMKARIEREQQQRVAEKIAELRKQYGVNDDRSALDLFEQAELTKTREIDKIEKTVAHPRFTDRPPMTPDDDIRYRQFRLGNVPVTAALFDAPATLDIGLSFDLRKIPRRYYKYLPLFPQCIDSLGLRQGSQVTPYPELLARIRKTTYAFAAYYDTSTVSPRADFTLWASATSTAEFRMALDLIHQVMTLNDLDVRNDSRLRDLITQRLAQDDSYTQQDENAWIPDMALSFRRRDDLVFFALRSQFAGAHWDGRLKWLLHRPVSAKEIEELGAFSENILSSASGAAKEELLKRLGELKASELEEELLEYWRRNFSSFRDAEIAEQLRRLTREVLRDLGTGPAAAIADLRELQKIVLDRDALQVNLTLSPAALEELRPDLTNFLKSIPSHRPSTGGARQPVDSGPARAWRDHGILPDSFPQFVGLVNPNATTGDVDFYADFPSHLQTSRAELLKILASGLFSGAGPHSFYMKTWTAGYAYNNGLNRARSSKLMWYYADRSPDLPSLLALVNTSAAGATELKDPWLLDYALRQTFSLPRSMLSSSQRGYLLAQDLRDGNTPDRIRRFSEAILQLKKQPGLFPEITRIAVTSICGVLVREECKERQRESRSTFFFVGSEKILRDAEERIPNLKLTRLWPGDYWIE